MSKPVGDKQLNKMKKEKLNMKGYSFVVWYLILNKHENNLTIKVEDVND